MTTGFIPRCWFIFEPLEEKKAERLIFDGVVDLLIELGLVKRKGKHRLDSTHIVGYVKAMSWMECAIETLGLGWRNWNMKSSRTSVPSFGADCGSFMWRAIWIGG